MSKEKTTKELATEFVDQQLKQGNADIIDIATKFADKQTAPLKVKIEELESKIPSSNPAENSGGNNPEPPAENSDGSGPEEPEQ